LFDQPSGIARCLDAKTGKEHYRKRVPKAAGFTASPVAGDGKIYCLDQSGLTIILRPGPTLEVIAANKLGEMFWASPAIAGDKLLLRGIDHLYCIRGTGGRGN
jgi:outer membrane protein assembly factor BamB